MNIKPRNDQVVIKACSQERITKGGIVIPEDVQKAGVAFAEIVSVGPGTFGFSGKRDSIDLKPGQTVMFIKHPTLLPVSIDDRSLFLADEKFILAIVED